MLSATRAILVGGPGRAARATCRKVGGRARTSRPSGAQRSGLTTEVPAGPPAGVSSAAAPEGLQRDPLRVCVVGSGPSGMYTVDRLLRRTPASRELSIDVLDSLPTPFGLVRSGVAPDHPETKNVEQGFTRLLEDHPDVVRWLGGVRVASVRGGEVAGEEGWEGGARGPSEGDEGGARRSDPGGSEGVAPEPAPTVLVSELRGLYDAVVLAHGTEADAPLGIPGESLPEVVPARRFVWWYNGHPSAWEGAATRGGGGEGAATPGGAGGGSDDESLDALVGRLEGSPAALEGPLAATPPPLRPLDLSRTRSAVVLGLGNVALDCARVLLCDAEERLARTDAASRAVRELATAPIADVHVVARRGPAQAACTAKELREALGLPGVVVRFHGLDDPAAQLDDKIAKAAGASRATLRVLGILREAYEKGAGGFGGGGGGGPEAGDRKEDGGAPPAPPPAAERTLHLHFFRAPREVLPGTDGGAVEAIVLEKTRLEHEGEPSPDAPDSAAGPAGATPPRPRSPSPAASASAARVVGTGELETLPADLVLPAVGYRGIALRGVPYDARRGTVPNVAGAVLGARAASERRGAAGGSPASLLGEIPGLFVVGWAKRGPSGIVGTNLRDAEETVGTLLDRAAEGALPAPRAASPGPVGLDALLRARGVRPVPFSGWKEIDAHERGQGHPLGKPREKLLHTSHMRKVALGAAAE